MLGLVLALILFSPFLRAEPPDVVQVAPGVWRIHLGEPERLTPMTFRSAPLVPRQFDGLPDCPMPIDREKIGFAATGRGCVVSLPLANGEKIYGLGLNTNLFELTGTKGRRAMIRPTDHPENNSNDSHAPVPFYVSTAGYGVFVDTARYAAFYIGDAAPKAGALQKKRILVDIPSAHGVDLYLFGGPAMKAAVQRYNLFSGGGCVPPLWGLGMAFRGAAKLDGGELEQLAHSFRDLQIPCDIWGVEPEWQSKSYSCSFAWNFDKFPDPGAFLARMKAAGYHLNLWEHCFTHPSSPLYLKLRPYSGDYLVWNGLVPDFATPEARQLFGDYHDQLLFAHGVDGMKLDECDNQPPSDAKGADTPWSFPEASRFPSGLDGEQMHSLLGVLYQQTLWGPLRQRNRRTWGLVRDSQALAAPLPYTVYSDSYTDRCYLRGLVKEGFAGLLWTPEVRDAGSLEELYRRMELVIFSPFAQVDCWYMKLPPWEQMNRAASNRREVMPGHRESEQVVRRLSELRMSFLPYLYSAFNEYRLHGTPPIRALVMDWPADPATFDLDDQFMFGPSVMVAPLLKGEAKRSVYLPAGLWHDYWTGETIAGGRKIEVAAPVDRIPLYVEDNTLLPLAQAVQHVAPDTRFEMTVRVYGKSPSNAVLYEDDGISYDFERGGQNLLTLQWKEGRGTSHKSGSYAGPARYEVVNWTAP